jgi:ubiquinol-cytochrome c reductase cytochrome b/c1 subunit
VNWIEERLPIFSMAHHTAFEYPTPKNLNYWWNFGSLAAFCLVVMILTGVFLAMSYTPNTVMAFDSVERIMRDVNYGWLLRYMHSNGASLFFIVVYIHIFRGLYYGSYKAPRELLWFIGIAIYLAMMATGFLGYVLPWGQMSFWGATVITNLFSAFPVVGESIVTLLWGGFSVDNPTLNRFFALHYLLPFVIVGLVALHVWALHSVKSNNPLGIDMKGPQDSLPFHPYYTIKDLYGIGVFLLAYFAFVFWAPNFFGEPDNYIPANPMLTPPHIVPEWYYLPFYAILRAFTADLWFIPAKLMGVVAMFSAILILFALPWLDSSKVRSGSFRPLFRQFFWLFVVDCVVLGYCGAKPAEGILVTISQVATAYYFAHFLVILPLIARKEKPLPLPASISAPVVKSVVLALAIVGGTLGFAGSAQANEGGHKLLKPEGGFSFEGVFGRYDRASLKRGFQVYHDICSNCHGLKYIAYRNLTDIGFTADEAKAFAAEKEVQDGPNDEGAMFTRPARPSDHFVAPFANDKAAAYVNGGAIPPDLSLVTKARAGGPYYIYSLLLGYPAELPEGATVPEGKMFNTYFPGNAIGMPQQVFDDVIAFNDGTAATKEQIAKDVVTFLNWAAEPELEARKSLGVKVMVFLALLTALFYALKRQVWADVH